MKKRRFIAIILSAAMICAFPVFVFADTNVSTTSYLSDAQMSSAQFIKVGDTLSFPAAGQKLIYKFVAEKSGYYGVQGTLAKDSPEDFSVIICRENTDGTCTYAGDFGGYSISEYDIEKMTNGFQKGMTYYLVISNPEKCTIDMLHFKSYISKTVKLSTTKGGTLYEDASMGSKVKTAKLLDSQEGGDTVYVHPNKGYAFKGFYCNGYKLQTIYDGNDVYGLYYTDKVTKNTVTAKFVKLQGNALKFNSSKVTGLSGTIEDNTISLNWKNSSVKYEVVVATYPEPYAWGAKKVSENTYSLKFPIDLTHGDMLKCKVRAIKTYNGIEVASKWTSIKVEAK